MTTLLVVLTVLIGVIAVVVLVITVMMFAGHVIAHVGSHSVINLEFVICCRVRGCVGGHDYSDTGQGENESDDQQ